MPVIGFLGASESSVMTQWVAAFVQRLRELGWVEGRNIAIEYRWAEGRLERLAEFAAELVRLKVDIIFAADGTASTLAARQATSVIPIVFPISGDPVTSALVASLGRPGGNVTGLSILASDLAGKRLELLRELVSSLRRLAILANVDSPNAVLEMGEVQAAARILGLEVAKCEIRGAWPRHSAGAARPRRRGDRMNSRHFRHWHFSDIATRANARRQNQTFPQMWLLTLMRHLLLIGGGPIGVASGYIKRFSNHPNQAQPTQE